MPRSLADTGCAAGFLARLALLAVVSSAGCDWTCESRGTLGVGAPSAPAVGLPPDASTAGDAGACSSCGAPVVRGTAANDLIKEASGLVASARHAGVLYAHNDSGDTARFFALSATGADLGAYALEGSPAAIDWEDMARGPCAGGSGSCLYFGDVGDNKEQRPSCSIHRVAEPDTVGPGDHVVAAETFVLSYPDGSHNAESLLVHPRTGVVTIVTKVAAGESTIYESNGPLERGRAVVLQAVGKLASSTGSPRFTAGDVHPAATGVLMRTYTHLFLFAMKPEQTVAQALAASPCIVPDADEEQGETIAWLAAGGGYVTLSEGLSQKLNEVTCR